MLTVLISGLPASLLLGAVAAGLLFLVVLRRRFAPSGRLPAGREDLELGDLRSRYFAEFEEAPFEAMLLAVAAARRLPAGRLRPHDPLDDRQGSAADLRERVRLMNVSVDWSRVLTVRQLVAAAVPLRETDPSAHH